MKILVIGNFHHKNKESLEKILKYLKFEYKFGDISEVKNFKVIISPNIPINTSIFPNKFFIFGPHFSVFPNQLLYKIYNVHKNSIYLQPSYWALNVWKKFNVENIIPLKVFYFPINTKKFKPLENTKKEKVFIYFKRRKQTELSFLKTFLHNKNIEFKIFDYVKRYEEEDYLKYLQESKYGIILDAHESQGFAIEEALSCNVPLLVWNVTSMNQEEGISYPNIPATSIPYWDNRCGSFFYKKEEFEEKYNEFITKLETYKPREFVLENLSVEKCAVNFKKLFS
jgi:hypothetical protein